MGLFDDIFDVTSNITDILLTPVEVAVSLSKDITEPLAETVKELSEDIKSITK